MNTLSLRIVNVKITSSSSLGVIIIHGDRLYLRLVAGQKGSHYQPDIFSRLKYCAVY